MGKSIWMFVFVLFFAGSVAALGVTPGRTVINYEKGLSEDFGFSVLNNDNEDMQVLLSVEGELNDSVTLYDSLVEFSSDEESKQFRYTVNLNEDLEPGLHVAEIAVLKIPKLKDGAAFVGATLKVLLQVHVYVPYPGKYVEADLNILDMNQNTTATLIVPVKNRGKLGIGEVRALIDIHNSFGDKVYSVDTDYFSLDPGARTELSAKWDVNVSVGNYVAKVNVFYDGETKYFEKQFGIGVSALIIESISVNNFQLGQIAKLQILVENRWSNALKGVYSNLIVYDDEHDVMADVKSSSEDIDAFSKKNLIVFWDTVGVSEGEYDGKLMVSYGQKSTDKNLLLKVSENSLDIIGVGYAIRGDGAKGVSVMNVLVVVVLVLIVVNLAWLVIFMRKRSKGKK